MSTSFPQDSGPFRRILGTGGLLPPKKDGLTARDPNLAARLARFSENRARAIRGLTWKERENLTVQMMKRIRQWTGAGERTIKNWFDGSCGPRGEPLFVARILSGRRR
ncbi:hypothetical protein ACVWXO_004342 [Bradyrhizobium sp. LM2.7]